MDLVGIVDGAIERLPKGEYSAGLSAIQRHISAAIRHFEREDDGSQDSFTDAIYRCNQAFEGGLKEAYRVMAGKDPSKLTPHKIEEYLEKHEVIRPRALKQLTRYREDYRNPSTHDYKLDFDEDEALLAIVAVCAFARLLVNQISGRLAFDAGRGAATGKLKENYTSNLELAQDIATSIHQALSKIDDPSRFTPDDLTEFLDGILGEKGVDTEVFLDNDGSDGEHPWDITAKYGARNFNVDSRLTSVHDIAFSLRWISRRTLNGEATILVIFDEVLTQNEYQIVTQPADGGGDIIVVLPSGEVGGLQRNEELAIQNLKKLR